MQPEAAGSAPESRAGLSAQFTAAATLRSVLSARETAAAAGETAEADVKVAASGAADDVATMSPTAVESGATLSNECTDHPQHQRLPLLGKRASGGEQLHGEPHGASEGGDNVFLSVDDDDTDSAKNNDTSLVIAAFVLSFLFPPLGCLIFCLNLTYPPDSPRYVWAVRALEVGSLLSFVYSLVIIMLLSDFTLVYSQNKAHFGVGF